MTKKDVINTLEKIGDDTINGIKSSHGNIRIKIENFKKRLSFISDIISKGDYSKIKSIGKFYDSFEIDFKKIILVDNKEKILNKLLNNKFNNDKLIITVSVHFNKKNIDTIYKILFNESISSVCAYYSRKIHPIIENEIFSEYNNIDIKEEYLNNIYKVAENFRDKFINMNIDKQYFMDFVNYSSATQFYKNQIKESISGHDINCAAFTDMIFKYYENKILLEFVKMFFEREYSAIFNFDVIDSYILNKYNAFKSQNVVLNNILG